MLFSMAFQCLLEGVVVNCLSDQGFQVVPSGAPMVDVNVGHFSILILVLTLFLHRAFG